MTLRTTPLAVLLALLLAACGGAVGGPSLSAGSGDGSLLTCGDAIWQEDGLDALAPLDELPDDVLAATDDIGEPVVDGSLPWRVAEQGDTEVVLVRELAFDDPDAADGATHAALSLFRVDGDPNIEPGTWFYASGDVCTPPLAEGNEGEPAELRLADTPSPDDASLQLLVMERGCASGQSADGRVRVDDLALTESEVRLRVSVVPPGGDQECPGNPWTQLEVDMREPLGDRTVVDANVVPAQELVVGTAEPEPFDPEAESLDDAVARALEFTPWPDYTLQVETTCFCSSGTYEVVVREGEVVARRPATPRVDGWLPAADLEEPNVHDAPSLLELQERLAEAYESDSDTITELVVDETGVVLRVAFDPELDAVDDEVAYRLFADVDSPGDPIDQDRAPQESGRSPGG